MVDEVSGKTFFWQKKTNEGNKPVRLDTKWINIPAHDYYNLSVLESDLDDC